MAILKRVEDFIKNLDEKEFLQYALIFFTGLGLLLSLIFYFHYKIVNKYKTQLTEINKERNKTKEILTNYRLVLQQREKVEDVLAKDKNFFIAQTYNNILKKLNLSNKQVQAPTRSDGDTISGKIEKRLTSNLDGLTMETLTNLLTEIAENERLYPKELSIKKVPGSNTIDVELTIATLESVEESE